MVEVDAGQVLTIPRQIKATEVVKRGFMSNFLFDNIAGIFNSTQLVLDILEELPQEKEGRVNKPETNLDFSDVNVDDNGKVVVSETVINHQQENLFGQAIYSLENVVSENQDVHEPKFGETISKGIAETFGEQIANGYDLNKREQSRIEKQIEESIQSDIKSLNVDYQIKENHLKAEEQKALKEASQDEAKQHEIRQEFEAKRQEIAEDFKETVKTHLQEKVEELPRTLVIEQEERLANKAKRDKEHEIQARLRGLSLTIPSFIMAYGDENLTLSNFDEYMPKDVFKEVTGITIEQFRLLRDGGDLQGEHIAGHLFEEQTFNESVQEFLRKKNELADYFENDSETIFDYIPNLKNNLIFTPLKVVKRMVQSLEDENPGIFDDSSKTFFDQYMKSGLYITEIIKRLNASPVLIEQFPEKEVRLKHILENQVYGFVPTPIIYKIATNFIFGILDESISRDNFVQVDSTEAAMKGTMQELVDQVFGE